MPVHFLDSSFLARAYLRDEAGHEEARALLSGDDELLASELARIEVARAIASAHRKGRLPTRIRDDLLAEVGRDLSPEGAIEAIVLDPEPTLARARELVIEYAVRTLDAIHLAVAEREGRALAEPDELVFATRDEGQRKAAQKLGLRVE